MALVLSITPVLAEPPTEPNVTGDPEWDPPPPLVTGKEILHGGVKRIIKAGAGEDGVAALRGAAGLLEERARQMRRRGNNSGAELLEQQAKRMREQADQEEADEKAAGKSRKDKIIGGILDLIPGIGKRAKKVYENSPASDKGKRRIDIQKHINDVGKWADDVEGGSLDDYNLTDGKPWRRNPRAPKDDPGASPAPGGSPAAGDTESPPGDGDDPTKRTIERPPAWNEGGSSPGGGG